MIYDAIGVKKPKCYPLLMLNMVLKVFIDIFFIVLNVPFLSRLVHLFLFFKRAASVKPIPLLYYIKKCTEKKCTETHFVYFKLEINSSVS